MDIAFKYVLTTFKKIKSTISVQDSGETTIP